MLFVSALLMGGRLEGAAESAQEAARSMLEGLRTEKDRALTTLVVPEGKEGAELPEGAEVYLIRGYINYTCVRIFVRDQKVIAQRVKMARSWFYSPKEDYSAKEWEIPPGDFARAWETVRLIREAAMPRNVPPKQGEMS